MQDEGGAVPTSRRRGLCIGIPIRFLPLSIAIAIALAPTAGRTQDDALFAARREIARKLVCQCGCQLVLADCTHETCPSKPVMNAEIESRLEKGEAPDAIVAAFVETYGLQVLAAPPARGFNLMVWVAPFVALLLGAIFVTRLVRRWARNPGEEGGAAVRTEVDGEYVRRVEQELEALRKEDAAP